VKWQLPIQVDGLSGDCFVEFPDDLLEAANLKEGETVEWIDRGDGSFELRKVTKPLEMDEC
jgi:bifunctional DNA-binding transcriptional regulator/antitoxin component of YhaV-PrlF toxin-antitoxin module